MDNVVSCKELYDGEIPLWSIGRLMEIYDTCTELYFQYDRWCSNTEIKDGFTYIDYVMDLFEYHSKSGHMDFSKLED